MLGSIDTTRRGNAAIKGLEKRRVTRDCRLIGGDRNRGFCNKGGGTQLLQASNEAILFMSIDFVDTLCARRALLDCQTFVSNHGFCSFEMIVSRPCFYTITIFKC